MKIKKIIFFIQLSLIILFLSLSSNDDKPFIESIRVVIDNNYPPYIFINEDKEIVGYLVDLWNEWEKITGTKVILIATNWIEAQKIMQSSGADVIDTIFFNEERAKIYSFSKPYATINVPIFHHNSITGIADFKSLKGFVVGVKEGDAAVDFLEKNGIRDLILYKSYEDIISSAKSGNIKIFTVDAPCAYYYLNKYNITENFSEAFTMYSGQFHRAVKKGNEPLLQYIENGFQKIPKTTYKILQDKWFGRSILQRFPTRYIRIALMILLIIFLIAFLVIIILRSEVKRRTQQLNNIIIELKNEKRITEYIMDFFPDFIVLFEGNLEVMHSHIPSYFYDSLFNDNDSKEKKDDQQLAKKFLDLLEENSGNQIKREIEDFVKNLETKENTEHFEFESIKIIDNNIKLHTTDYTFLFNVRLFAINKDTFLLISQNVTDKVYLERKLVQKQKLEMIGNFSSGLAHDINNILHSILSISSLIKMSIDDETISKETLSEYTNLLEKSALKGKDTIETLLYFSRGSSDEKKIFDLNKMIDNSIEVSLFQLKRKVELIFDRFENPAFFFGHENLLEQILISIILNSYDAILEKEKLKAMNEELFEGSKEPINRIYIKLEKKSSSQNEMQISKNEEDNLQWWCLKIRDSGAGIKKDDLDHVFNPFYTTKGQGLGKGLSLTTAYNIIKENGGDIQIDSEYMKWTEITILLPCNAKNFGQDVFIDLTEYEKGEGTILLVDDDKEITNLTKSILEKLGYTILLANNGEEALKVYMNNKENIDLAILDLVLPDINGTQLLQSLRVNGFNKKIIFCTGFKDDERLVDIQNLDVYRVINKPFLFDELSKIIKSALSETT
jgi:signal transduction histidine kinase/CheY-like chemotaxis protein